MVDATVTLAQGYGRVNQNIEIGILSLLRSLLTSVGAVLVMAVAVLAASRAATAHDRGAYWRVAEAESISSVRGTPVRVRECRSLGRPSTVNGVRRYRHFSCIAGARRPGERYDSVAVVYVLHPLGPYRGPRSRHALTNVRFVGGPGIP